VAEIVKDLCANGYDLRYYWWLETPEDAAYISHFNQVRFEFFERNANEIVRIVRDGNIDLVVFTNLWGTDWLRDIRDAMIALDEAGRDARVVMDTMDYHAKKYFRKHDLSGDKEDFNLAMDIYELEKEIYRLADHTVTVSAEERISLHEAFGEDLLISVVGNVHRLEYPTAGFHERRHFVFLGNYSVPHNVDAVQWFVDHIWEKVRQDMPGAELHLVGKDADRVPASIKSRPGVVLKGYVEVVSTALADYRVMVVPLTYGAGMKGKIGQAAACGLPVVTTRIGAEGFAFTDGVDALIADDPQSFAHRCVLLHTDQSLWQTLADNSLALMRNTFSADTALASMRRMVASLLA
jgi:glycosyltransferase involved in cell wall biosynthesis